MSAMRLLTAIAALTLLVVSLAVPATVRAGELEDREDNKEFFNEFDDDGLRFVPRRFFFREFDDEDDLIFGRRFIPRRFFFGDFDDDD